MTNYKWLKKPHHEQEVKVNVFITLKFNSVINNKLCFFRREKGLKAFKLYLHN